MKSPIGAGGPSMLATCFLIKFRDPRCSGRGTPWMALGSFIKDGSNFDGTLVVTARYSPGNFALGTGTDAVRQMWSDVSPRYGGMRVCLEPEEPPEEMPCEALMVDRRDRPLNPPSTGRPRAFFASMISSKSRTDEWPGGCLSLS